MSYPSDLTDDQWEVLEVVFNAPGKRSRKHAHDLRTVVDAMLHIAQTGCQWRHLPQSVGPSGPRRWSSSTPADLAVLALASLQPIQAFNTDETLAQQLLDPRPDPVRGEANAPRHDCAHIAA